VVQARVINSGFTCPHLRPPKSALPLSLCSPPPFSIPFPSVEGSACGIAIQLPLLPLYRHSQY
jgi:hypothetical protein